MADLPNPLYSGEAVAAGINIFGEIFTTVANELLVQCLKVAVVSDRQGILDGLLAPPKET